MSDDMRDVEQPDESHHENDMHNDDNYDVDVDSLVSKTRGISIHSHNATYRFFRDRHNMDDYEHYMNIKDAPDPGRNEDLEPRDIHGMRTYEVLGNIQRYRRRTNEFYEEAREILTKLGKTFNDTKSLLENIDTIFAYIERNLIKFTGVQDMSIPKFPLYFDPSRPDFKENMYTKPEPTPYMIKCRAFYSSKLKINHTNLEKLQHAINNYAKKYKSNADLFDPPEKPFIYEPQLATDWLRQCIYMIMATTLYRAAREIYKLNKVPEEEITQNQKNAKKLLAKLCHCLEIGNDARLKGLEYVLAINDKIEVFEW